MRAPRRGRLSDLLDTADTADAARLRKAVAVLEHYRANGVHMVSTGEILGLLTGEDQGPVMPPAPARPGSDPLSELGFPPLALSSRPCGPA